MGSHNVLSGWHVEEPALPGVSRHVSGDRLEDAVETLHAAASGIWQRAW